ncbi:uridine diphosphate-N-acetylglucosamine-binding protein YvcK [Erysipelothrix rhusiopathiae]|uniref:gluconeogenesis factor YvcK family protein n=1 Tax=Erysipelothrix rhusiopathiae TaxID=1648 RepID=UPI000F437292|nr:uridine diphosphate-N-acetylglucosamine-binding protein YvcK [Erysipelothrix rhusiopathiae]AYV33981.1 uridine diphosphate-N-acetylglucosamine-binding protein YvcK [Erysipelothrix rhusiopathiae]MDE8081584.1 uridine diphosphate-N-acetylglucosamine-binding protein YvcK [Erysipelothrix rhusiopathiae]MDE8313910.1 uridine diphosphate-N-acetylglucosamine-binding protein YvcK [Erysipelothrix rhusiopathiae]MDE8328807.1 uridine diphosphate-N-acetylglucosamine-binding protein YvcK [Erysipelothrix rhusi
MKVAVVGGGKGQSALLRGLKHIESIELSAIVTVADDGGSTGRLREDFNVPAMGDIRNVMLALAESENLLSQIMNYRFSKDSRSTLAGHNLGNLILTALTDTTGDFMDAVASVSKVLNVMGDIIPSSEETITLCARMEDGTIVRGESNIPKYANSIDCVYYDEPVHATDKAIKAILEADVILLGVGSLYTSILPNIIIPEIKAALQNSTGKIIYYCNAMSQPGETDGYSGEDHVNAIVKHIEKPIDLVVRCIDEIPADVIQNYENEDSHPIYFRSMVHTYAVVDQNLLSFENGKIRHDHDRVREGFYEILEVIGCPLAVK